ncbi:sodium-dependent transporter [uncultured Desulfuromonas sp.]|uniref:sodium-dependent transporter n=1 Tax=uncultured Desulfuromonas sp. TaxID=181013 RepID=UPI00261C56CA|nr:sodium-dependent transporter [uncultured Desulfuromonas sp.]
MADQRAGRAHWASRFGFVLAAAGSAIGLGNIWKFPYITGQNGGGAFVLVYLGCIVVVGLPIMMAEFLIGRHGQRDAVGSFVALEGKGSPWCLVGWGGVAASFIVLSFYAVVAGWSFDYVVKSAMGTFPGRSAGEINALFGGLVSSPLQVVFWQGFFVAATVSIVLGGIRGGIERWSKILMPVLFMLLVLLFVRGMLSPGAGAALDFMFRPDFGRLTPQALLDALGHAFFTLSLGAGTMITYGSYLHPKSDLFSLSVRITVLDTLVALLSGLAIFSVVFAAGLEPAAGPGLVFQTIPIVFASLPFGSLLAFVFFVLLAFAALSSSISMLEVSVAYLIDEKGWGRKRSTFLIGSLAFLVGLPSALSFNVWAQVTPLFGKTFFDLMDVLVSSYMFPLGGLFVALYAGWFWKGEGEKEELLGGRHRAWLFPLWHFLLRYVAPSAVLLILLNQIGVF